MTITTSTLEYGDESPLQIVKKYEITAYSSVPLGEYTTQRNFITIHGGAWRSVINTCADYDDFAKVFEGLVGANEKAVVYSIDYEVSSHDLGKFPTVVKQVLKGLNVIYEDSVASNGGKELDFVICGHSVGSTFITQILERENLFKLLSDNESIPKIPGITKAVFLDGIYSIKLLLEEYPQYEFFILEEFAKSETALKCCNAISDSKATTIGEYAKLDKIVVVHSFSDELLTIKQPDNFLEWLDKNGVSQAKIEKHYGEYGQHNDVYVNSEVAKILFNC